MTNNFLPLIHWLDVNDEVIFIDLDSRSHLSLIDTFNLFIFLRLIEKPQLSLILILGKIL